MKTYHFSDEAITKILNVLAKEPYLNVFELIRDIEAQFSYQANIQNNIEHTEGE